MTQDGQLALLAALLRAPRGHLPPFSELAKQTGLTVPEIRKTIEALLASGVLRVEEHSEGKHRSLHQKPHAWRCWYCGRGDGDLLLLASKEHRVAHQVCAKKARDHLTAGAAVPVHWTGPGATNIRWVPPFDPQAEPVAPAPRRGHAPVMTAARKTAKKGLSEHDPVVQAIKRAPEAPPLTPSQRRAVEEARRGEWFTPGDVAAQLVERRTREP